MQKVWKGVEGEGNAQNRRGTKWDRNTGKTGKGVRGNSKLKEEKQVDGNKNWRRKRGNGFNVKENKILE